MIDNSLELSEGFLNCPLGLSESHFIFPLKFIIFPIISATSLIEISEEVERINKLKETNDKLEKYFTDKRENWKKEIEPLFETIKVEINLQTSRQIIETQSLCLTYRQKITEEISSFLDKRSKQDVKLKRIKQDKFIWYATSFGIKTNMGEKSLLIEAHVAEEQRNIELIENYIEYLRQTNKNLESLQFTIKNIIDLFNYLGR